MSVLSRFFGTRREEAQQKEPAACLHIRLVPYWDNLQDMGDKEKVTHYKCEGCHATFSREEGQARMWTTENKSGSSPLPP